MQALVLVGGEGTRLRPLTLTRPKPALPLVDRPFIRYIVDWLARHGVDDVVMACGFGADPLREVLGEGDGKGPASATSQKPEPLGTAGPLRLAADQGLLDDRFLVLNGDLLSDLDLGALIRAHEERGAVATLASIRSRTRAPTDWFAAPEDQRPPAPPQQAPTARCSSSSRSRTPARSTLTRSTPAPTCSSAA